MLSKIFSYFSLHSIVLHINPGLYVWLPFWVRLQRILLQRRRPGFNPWVRKIPWKEGMATHSSALAWRILWTEETGGLQPMGLQKVGHEWETNTQWRIYSTYDCNMYIQFPLSLRHHSNCISFLVVFWLFVVYIRRPYTTRSGYLSIHYAQYDNHDQWTDAQERYNPAFQQSKSVTVLLESYGQGFLVFQCQLANCIQVCCCC